MPTDTGIYIIKQCSHKVQCHMTLLLSNGNPQQATVDVVNRIPLFIRQGPTSIQTIPSLVPSSLEPQRDCLLLNSHHPPILSPPLLFQPSYTVIHIGHFGPRAIRPAKFYLNGCAIASHPSTTSAKPKSLHRPVFYLFCLPG